MCSKRLLCHEISMERTTPPLRGRKTPPLFGGGVQAIDAQPKNDGDPEGASSQLSASCLRPIRSALTPAPETKGEERQKRKEREKAPAGIAAPADRIAEGDYPLRSASSSSITTRRISLAANGRPIARAFALIRSSSSPDSSSSFISSPTLLFSYTLLAAPRSRR